MNNILTYNSFHPINRCRSGTVLIVVVGLSVVMISISLTFFTLMRSDVRESQTLVQEAQARLTLIAALHYIQEASRLGYDDSKTPEHEEAYGWADIRDGSPGPKDQNGKPLYKVGSGKFPDIGGEAARFPLYVMEQPPFAIKNTYTYNPAPIDPSMSWSDLVNQKNPDPQPASRNWVDFALGKPLPKRDTVGICWFRIYREKNDRNNHVEPATFTIACGAGGTHGYKNFQDAVNDNQGHLFQNDPYYFNRLRAEERILWFRCEWTSAVGGSGTGIRMADGNINLPEVNLDSYKNYYGKSPRQHWWLNRNFLGSILWIQRLEYEPTNW